MATLKNDLITWRCLFNMVTAFKTVYSFIQCSKHTKRAFCIGRFLLSFLVNFLQTFNLLLKTVLFRFKLILLPIYLILNSHI